MKSVNDANLRKWIARDFTERLGCSRLARALGVSQATASALRAGGGCLVKVAKHYRFDPDPNAPGQWIASDDRQKPAQVGYKKWSLDVQKDVRRRLSAGEPLQDIADAHSTNVDRLRKAIKRHNLREPAGLALHYELGAAECRLRGDSYGERMIRAEQQARAAGGTLSEQLAHMQSAMMSDEDRKRWNDELMELIDAAA